MLMKQLSKMFKRQCKPLSDAIRYPANNNSNCANNNSNESSDSERYRLLQDVSIMIIVVNCDDNDVVVDEFRMKGPVFASWCP